MHDRDTSEPAVSFEQLQAALSGAMAEAGAAESHGTLCGAVCAGVAGENLWLTHVLGDSVDNPTARECHDLLIVLSATAHQQLMGLDMDFVPLLPDDAQPLTQRVEALGLWCQGFLFGLSLGQPRAVLDTLAGEAGEVLQDLSEIARAGFESGNPDEHEADERAFTELVEYVRVAVQVLYEELQRLAAVSLDSQQPVTLH